MTPRPEFLFHHYYIELLHTILYDGVLQQHRRTKTRIRILPTPTAFIIDLRFGQVPVPGNRKLSPVIAAAEVAWMLQGDCSITWLQQYTSIWNKFVDLPATNSLRTAYGYRWRYHFQRDQLDAAMLALQHDNTNRQVLVSAWDPAIDGLGHQHAKNVPCPTHFSLYIVEGRLSMALFIRSSDVFVGLPYDVMSYAFLLQIFGTTLQYPIGWLHVTLGHAHIYEPHFGFVKTSLVELPNTHTFSLPSDQALSTVRSKPEAYVACIQHASATVVWPDYHPNIEVVL